MCCGRVRDAAGFGEVVQAESRQASAKTLMDLDVMFM